MSDNPAAAVDPVDPVKKTSEIAGPTGDEATVSMELLDAKCLWNDAEYEQGQRVSADGKCYECSFGRWIEVED
ncbi:MAG: hypothetical protein ACE5GZ_02755 [Gammaproteobacteria bacterium]